MANINDYLRWRGDLSLSDSPFCEVDNLILCKLASFDFSGIVPRGFSEHIPLRKAVKQLFARVESEDEIQTGFFSHDEFIEMIKLMADSLRFSSLPLSGFVNRIDHAEQEQFCAMKIGLDKKTDFIAFRGTDDTLVGWKENFNMTYLLPVPSQASAASYLTACEFSGRKKIIIGGHSKGGNLAVYSAASVPEQIQKRIIKVYNNDGPGFELGFIQGSGYKRIADRVSVIVPYYSIVGILMEHESRFEVVSSIANGPMQHDGFKWEVQGSSFVRAEALSSASRFWDKTINSWVASTNLLERKLFVDTFYDLLCLSEAESFSELTENKLKSIKAVVGGMKDVDKSTRVLILKIINILIKQCIVSAREEKALSSKKQISPYQTVRKHGKSMGALKLPRISSKA